MVSLYDYNDDTGLVEIIVADSVEVDCYDEDDDKEKVDGMVIVVLMKMTMWWRR